MEQALFEQKTGVRSSYSALPSSQEQLEEFNVPFSIHYTPLKKIENFIVTKNKPVMCACGGFLNPFVVVNQ